MNKKIGLLIAGLTTVATVASVAVIGNGVKMASKADVSEYSVTISKQNTVRDGYYDAVATTNGNFIRYSVSNKDDEELTLGSLRGNGASIMVDTPFKRVTSVTVNFTPSSDDFTPRLNIIYSRNKADFNAGAIYREVEIASGTTYTTEGHDDIQDAYVLFWYTSSGTTEAHKISVESIVITYSC